MIAASDTYILSPELLGPIFKNPNINFRQALYEENNIRCLRIMATFVPDMLICLLNEEVEYRSYDSVVLMLLNISDWHTLLSKLRIHNQYAASEALKIINSHTSIIIELIAQNYGDVFHFTDSGILVLWQVNKDESKKSIIKKIISCFFTIKESIEHLEANLSNALPISVRATVAAGAANIALIGRETPRSYIMTGEVMSALRRSKKLAEPGYLILDESISKYCQLSDYECEIKSQNCIKIIRKHEKWNKSSTSRRLTVEELSEIQEVPLIDEISASEITTKPCLGFLKCIGYDRYILGCTITETEYCKTEASRSLKNFIIPSILTWIDEDCSLKSLIEWRNITVIYIKMTTKMCTLKQIIEIANDCHSLILRNKKSTHRFSFSDLLRICSQAAWIERLRLHDDGLSYRVVFGARNYLKNVNHCRFAIKCAWQMIDLMSSIDRVDQVTMGISTDLAYFTVIGHVRRRHYVIMSSVLAKAREIAIIVPRFYESSKIGCDLNSVLYSGLKRSLFKFEGLENLKDLGKNYIYSLSREEKKKELVMDKTFCILGRRRVLAKFDDILDDVGVEGRVYSGIIIEGDHAMGKSRVLDAYVLLARAKRFDIVKLLIHPSFAACSHNTINKILIQVFEATECKTVDELERTVIKNVGRILRSEELCYLNEMLTVRFKLSARYIVDSDNERHCKRIDIFMRILKLHDSKRCIVLDDAHNMDPMSWEFLKRAMNDKNIVLVMAILVPKRSNDVSQIELAPYNDERLFRHRLEELETRYLPALVCQFMNVHGFSQEIYK
uniref:Orc1-like AAA ATPase domain-containing protein n=1 Tax=Trichogramma kaykai TaxID=54128 RepID=A0ABD2XBT0_9HYME